MRRARRDNRRPCARPELVVLSLLLAIGLTSCGGTSLAPLSKSEGGRLEEDEQRIWNHSNEEIAKLDKSGYISTDTALTGYLNGVARKLAAEETLPDRLTINVKVIKNPLLNAFTYPTGTIYIHTGILAKMENEAQLATLIGHEMTHATHRHATENFRSVKNKAAVFSVFSVAAMPFGIYGALASLLGEVGTMAAISGYSQGLESEADNVGFDLMVGAGYDPHEAPKLFQHIKRDLDDENGHEPFFFGSHPGVNSRIDNYAGLVARKYDSRHGVTGEPEFMQRILPLLLDNVDMDLTLGRFVSAERTLDRYSLYDSSSGRAHYYLGEVLCRRPKQTDTAGALSEFATAIALDSTLPGPHKSLGLIHMKRGARVEATSDFEQYLALSPNAEDRKYIEQYLRSLKR